MPRAVFCVAFRMLLTLFRGEVGREEEEEKRERRMRKEDEKIGNWIRKEDEKIEKWMRKEEKKEEKRMRKEEKKAEKRRKDEEKNTTQKWYVHIFVWKQVAKCMEIPNFIVVVLDPGSPNCDFIWPSDVKGDFDGDSVREGPSYKGGGGRHAQNEKINFD